MISSLLRTASHDLAANSLQSAYHYGFKKGSMISPDLEQTPNLISLGFLPLIKPIESSS